MSQVLDSIGFFGPGILFIDVIWKLWGQRPYFLGYLATFALNYPLNKFLKLCIKQPRPEGGRSFMGESYNGADHYGMPSLHAQSTAITVAFLFLVKGFSYWTILSIFILALVVYQRWKYRRHTIEQLIVGSLLGGIMGAGGFYLTKTVIYKNSIV